jgi:glycosyltransferase involved in cell wall biosynthesis/3-hydroxyisobutyrate dehydrogenase-like beta-hydroxyacid dehydrogenase
MRVLTLSTDSQVFNEGSAVARRFKMQAKVVDRLDVIVPHGPGALVALAGNAAARGFGLGKFSGFLRTIAAGWRIDRPDVVSVQDPFLIGLLGWLIARMRGSRFHVQVHTDLFDPQFISFSGKNRALSYVARFILRRADAIRVVSVRVRDSLIAHGVRSPITVLPVFVDKEKITRAIPLNRRDLYPQFEKIILVVSRLEAEKDVVAAVRAMPEILKSIPKAGLLIVGSGSERKSLVTLVRQHGLDQQVIFEGAKDSSSYYKIADLVLVTSRYEGYGMVIVEALLAEVPVVSYDVGVAREAGAIVVSPNNLSEEAVAVLKSHIKGRLAFALPTEVEYRDVWRAQMQDLEQARPPIRNMPTEEQKKTKTIGFIGQGFIGKNYANDFEARGYKVVRYALEEPYIQNKELIPTCDIVFVAVPTPTTPQGFDDSIVRKAVALVGEGKTAVIKSTVLPGTTADIQKEFPQKTVLHSPEFLAEATAAFDAAHPTRNIVGVSEGSPEQRTRAKEVMEVLPPAPFELICTTTESELIKYINNTMLTMRVVFVNLVYDLAQSLGVDYEVVRDAVAADPRIGRSHLDPVHRSGHGGAIPGRGAGGHCFIKDFEALRRMYDARVDDKAGSALLQAIVEKNLDLLLRSHKDLDLLKSVYGEDVEKRILG